MSVQKPIADECFRVEQDVDASILIAHEVLGLADAPEKLARLGLLDEETLTVITLLELGPDGQVLNSRVGAVGPVVSQKTLATTLFPGAPENARLRIKLDYRCFNFPPGLTTSEWVSSDDLQWSIMKSNNMAQGGVYDQSTYKDIHVSPWSCRIVITPTEESHVACLSLVAIPRPISELTSLPGVVTGTSSAAYPVILLGRVNAAMAGVLETPRHDGLAFYPVVVNRGQQGQPMSFVRNIRRCSTPGAIAADAISKGDFATFHRVMPNHEIEPVRLPRSYIKWLYNPIVDPELGDKIIRELKSDGVSVIM